MFQRHNAYKELYRGREELDEQLLPEKEHTI